MNNPLSSVIIVSILLLQQLNSNGAVKIKSKIALFENATKYRNPDYFSRYVIKFSEDRQSMDVEAVLIRNITEPIWNRFSVEYKMKKDTNYRLMFNYETNVCEFLGKTTKESTNIFAIWIQNILKYSNLPNSCPILAKIYSWKNFRIERNSIPPVLMNGYYRANITNFLKTYHGKLVINNSTMVALIKMK
ncbi:uncharacterized protein [Musca autumnalis]|uniref:uncharacterized protein n=1 Tax=Musca autumnalis TaxID=221902 RepID=UPI003CF8C9C9